MLLHENQTESQHLAWIYEGISPTCHYGICGKWFCVNHALDEAWHSSALEPGDEGGEGSC